jgi:hypothetical protein
MNVYLLAGPSGLTTAVETLNVAVGSTDVFEELVDGVFRFLQTKVGAIEAPAFERKFASGGLGLSLVAVQSAINAVEYICNGARQFCDSSAALTAALASQTELEPAAVQAFARCYDASIAAVASGATLPGHLSMGQLAGLSWKVGVAVSSSHCDNLAAPFVTLVLKVAQRGGEIAHHPMELSIPEFQEFRKVIKDVGKTLQSM